MTTYTIPKNPGEFRVEHGGRGNHRAMNNKTGKNQVINPVWDLEHAEELCRRMNAGDHDGEVHA